MAQHPNQKYTDEDLYVEARKFTNKRDWRRYGRGYGQAWERGLLDLVTAHMKNPRILWDENKILSDVQKYSSYQEWRLANPSAYALARQKGILPKCKGQFVVKKIFFSDKELLKYREIYGSNKNWHKLYPESYNFALRNGKLKTLFKQKTKKYSIEGLVAESKKYKTRLEFCKSPIGQAARKRGIYEQLASKLPSMQSSPEWSLRTKIAEIFIDAKKKRFVNDIWKDKPYIHSFELDIYIPSQQIGIEFDGSYYHNPNVLLIGRKNWPKDVVMKYHEVKDQFFLEKGIRVFHIKEDLWRLNPQLCFDMAIAEIKRGFYVP